MRHDRGELKERGIWFFQWLKKNGATCWLRSAKERIKYLRFLNKLLPEKAEWRYGKLDYRYRSQHRGLDESVQHDRGYPHHLPGDHRTDRRTSPTDLHRDDRGSHRGPLRWNRGSGPGSDSVLQEVRRAIAPALLLTLILTIFIPSVSAVDIGFSDNNWIQGFSIDIYRVASPTDPYNVSYVTTWNRTNPAAIALEENGSYIGVLRQSQISRLNNFNTLSEDALTWVENNYIGLFFVAILLLIIVGRK